MSAILVDGLLGVAIAAAWIGAIGFVRLRSAFDRLHCVAFVNVGVGVPLLIAAFVSDGVSVRAFKLLVLVATALFAGAASSQAIARSILTRDEAGDPT